MKPLESCSSDCIGTATSEHNFTNNVTFILTPLGLILPNGDINWNCPCLGGMASGPCGQQFKDAFSCFHYSKEEVKGSECVEYFRGMQDCMQKYPELYPQEDESESAPSGGAEAAPAESTGTDSVSDSVSAATENPANS